MQSAELADRACLRRTASQPRPGQVTVGASQFLPPKPRTAIPLRGIGFGQPGRGERHRLRRIERLFHLRPRELTEEQMDRPLVDDRVVEREQKNAMGGGGRKERRPPQRRRRKIKRHPGMQLKRPLE